MSAVCLIVCQGIRSVNCFIKKRHSIVTSVTQIQAEDAMLDNLEGVRWRYKVTAVGLFPEVYWFDFSDEKQRVKTVNEPR